MSITYENIHQGIHEKRVMRACDVDRLYFCIARASVEKYGKRMTVVTMQIRVTLHSSDEILESFSLNFPRDDLKRR